MDKMRQEARAKAGAAGAAPAVNQKDRYGLESKWPILPHQAQRHEMGTQNAPVEDIDSYIASEGGYVDEVQKLSAWAVLLPRRIVQNPEGWTPQAEAADLVGKRLAGTIRVLQTPPAPVSPRLFRFGDGDRIRPQSRPFRAAREWMQGDGFRRSPRLPVAICGLSAGTSKRRREDRSPVASTVGAVAGDLGATAPLSAGRLNLMNGPSRHLLSMAAAARLAKVQYTAGYTGRARVEACLIGL